MLYKNAETLPGVFSSLRWPGIINGPLWTLPYELKLYISVAIAGTLGLLARPRIVLSGVVILAIGHTLIQTSFPAMQAGLLAAWMRLLFYYYAGVACFLYRDRILLNGLVALVGLAFVVVLAALRSSAAGAVFDLILPYLLLVLAFVPRGGVRLYNRLGDYSYGMYIFAFPIQQVLLQIKVGLTPYSFFFSAFSVTLVVAVASWHFVEKPALLMRDRIHTRADLWANLKGAFASRARVASPPSADVRAGGKSGCLEGDERPQKFPKI
jgi:peptidoglycan/LPS O-acetylase OafA/YrhL